MGAMASHPAPLSLAPTSAFESPSREVSIPFSASTEVINRRRSPRPRTSYLFSLERTFGKCSPRPSLANRAILKAEVASGHASGFEPA